MPPAMEELAGGVGKLLGGGKVWFGLWMGEDGEFLRSCNEPLAGPGEPAATGMPVSATVGVMIGTGSGELATGTDGAGGVVAAVGRGAGAWFKACGLIGGEDSPL